MACIENRNSHSTLRRNGFPVPCLLMKQKLDTTILYNPPFQNYNDFSGYFKVFP